MVAGCDLLRKFLTTEFSQFFFIMMIILLLLSLLSVLLQEMSNQTFNGGKLTAEELNERLIKENELLEKKIKKIKKTRRMVKGTKLNYDRSALLGKGTKALV